VPPQAALDNLAKLKVAKLAKSNDFIMIILVLYNINSIHMK